MESTHLAARTLGVRRVWLVLALVACGRQPPAPSPPTTAVASAAPPPAPAPTPIVITMLGPGELEIEGSGAVASEVAIDVDRDPNPTERVALSEPFRLIESCETKEAACVTLDHPLRPVRWSGLSCGVQCPRGCRANVHIEGRARFVVSTCDHQRTVESPSFRVPGGADEGQSERYWAIEQMISVTAAHESETKTLDDAQKGQLEQLFFNVAGFDDAPRKTCNVHGSTRLVVHHRLPTTATTERTEDVELLFTPACSELGIRRGKVIHTFHFDRSRTAVLAFLRGLFPG